MKRLSAVLLVLLLLFSGAAPAKANSAQTYWEGVDRAGVVVSDGNCPIVVEHELLTFDLQELLGPYDGNSGKVTAQYTFHNPSDMTVTAKLLFPFGQTYWYSQVYDPETGEYIDSDIQKYDICIDGVPVEKKIRHTLYQGSFHLDTDLPLVSDSFVEDSFFSLDLPVTMYKFEISDVDRNTYSNPCFGFDLPKGIGNQRLYLPNQRGGKIQANGTMRIIGTAKQSGFVLYVLREPLKTMPSIRIYQDGGVENGEEIAGTVRCYSTQTMTFKDFALENWSEESGVSEIDWYNATVADLKINTSAEHPVISRTSHANGFRDGFMRWYEYEITVEPGAKIVNSVTAPIYPSVNTAYKPAVYGYTYLLSPASTWKDFGKLDVVVNTPYYMTECSLSGFEKTDTGYKASFDGLPEGELTFQMSTSENPEAPKTNFFAIFLFFFAYIGYLFEALFDSIANLFHF